MTQHQHALWPEPTWTDSFVPGDRVSAKFTDNSGTVRTVKAGRYLLIVWDRPTVHTCRHHSPLGLVKA